MSSNNSMTKGEFEKFDKEFLSWIKDTSLDSLTAGSDVHKPVADKMPFIFNNKKNLDDYSNNDLIKVLSVKTGKDCYQVLIELTTSSYEMIIDSQQQIAELRADFDSFKQHNYELFSDLRSLLTGISESIPNLYQSIDNRLKNIEQAYNKPVSQDVKLSAPASAPLRANPPPPPPKVKPLPAPANPQNLRASILDELKAVFARNKTAEGNDEGNDK